MCTNYGNPKFIIKKGYLKGARLNIPKDYEGAYRVSLLGESPIVRMNQEKELQVDTSQFWLIPSYSDSRKPKYATFNTRDDKMLSGRTWKPIANNNQRCLIPVNYFFEPHTLSEERNIEGGKKPTNKVPFRIWLKSSEQFYIAGLWNEWTDTESGEIVLSHAVVTTKANDTMAKIHNAKKRMPAILPETALDDWLNDDIPTKEVHDLLAPWPDEDTAYAQITKQFDYSASGEEITKSVDNPIQL